MDKCMELKNIKASGRSTLSVSVEIIIFSGCISKDVPEEKAAIFLFPSIPLVWASQGGSLPPCVCAPQPFCHQNCLYILHSKQTHSVAWRGNATIFPDQTNNAYVNMACRAPYAIFLKSFFGTMRN